MKLYLVRHTRVDMPPNVCYGQTDVELAETYPQEADAVAEKLSDIRFEKAYSSPMSRCVKLAAQLNNPFQIDDRLKELNFGDFENQSWNTIFELEAGEKWFADYLNEACPNGESYNDLLNRVRRFIEDLPETNSNILVVTHAGVVRAFRVLLKNWSVKKAFEKPIAYGQITIIETK